MRDLEYAYKILGINSIAIERNLNGKRRSEEEKLLFLKERKEHKIHILKNKIQLIGISEETIKKCMKEINLVENAYNELVNSIQTNELGLSTKEENKFENLYNEINGIAEDAYSIFGTAREICERREFEGSSVKLDEAIKKRMEGLLKLADNKNIVDFREKQKNELRKNKIREAYELIKDSSARREYNKVLDMQQQERQEKLLRNMYQIKTNEKFNGQFEYRRYENKDKHMYYNQDNEPIQLTHTGVIVYKDFQGTSKIDEYEIERIINEEKYKDKIYINLSIFDLSIDKVTRQPIVNSEYYNYVINGVLSEANLLISEKYNNGYMGKIIKEKNRKYQNILDTKEATIVKEYSKTKYYNEKEEKGDR